MKKHSRLLLLCLLVAGSLLAAYGYGHWQGEKTVSVQRNILFYVDPMNPAHTSDKPGIAPCGMNMEPVYADEGVPGKIAGGASSAMPPGTVRVSPEKQQVIGVKTAVVEKAAWNHTIRVLGRIAPDETRLYRLNASTELWIRKIFGPTTGSVVKKDDRLLAYYSTNFLSAAASYMYALDTLERQRATGMMNPDQEVTTNLQVRQAVESLQNIGVSDLQIEEMAKTRKISDLVEIRSPTDGIILARTATLGMWVGPGTELYRIADLSRIWILADLFRSETGYVKPGMKVRVTVPHQKKELHAMVSDVLPQFDATSRTLKVRLEMENHGYLLKPDMFVDVEFPVQLPAAITVPVDAVIDSGLRNTVFVDRGNGFFEPRPVETGWRMGGQMEVTRGLMEGERIVVSGTFLIDSESRMKAAAAGMQAAAKAPQAPQRARDPICGMEVDIAQALAAGRMSEYRGKTYYFCMDQCKISFRKKPEPYLKEQSAVQAADRQAPRNVNPR